MAGFVYEAGYHKLLLVLGEKLEDQATDGGFLLVDDELLVLSTVAEGSSASNGLSESGANRD